MRHILHPDPFSNRRLQTYQHHWDVDETEEDSWWWSMIMHLQCCERSCLVFAVWVVELCWSQAVSCSAQQRQWSAPCSRYQHPSHSSHSSIPPWAVQHTPFTSTQLLFNKHSLTMRMFYLFRLQQWCNWGTHEPRNRNQWSKKILL